MRVIDVAGADAWQKVAPDLSHDGNAGCKIDRLLVQQILHMTFSIVSVVSGTSY